uniref:Transcriptional regulator n=1 Tax=Ignisphaera aggregans TaxID=334771 RepID=A0A7C4NL82_9CREN
MVKLLESIEEPITAEDIASSLDIDVNNVYIHLAHLAKTVRRSSSGKKALLMVPPRCRECGYIFKDLDKPKKPSKCPRCRSERIEHPRFIIRETE